MSLHFGGQIRRTMSLLDALSEFDAALEWLSDDDPLLEADSPTEWPAEVAPTS